MTTLTTKALFRARISVIALFLAPIMVSAQGANGNQNAGGSITGKYAGTAKGAYADAQGQPFPFTLTLKLEGEKVTGSSSSQLGTSTISSGVWKEGKLTLLLDSNNGQIGLIATLVDGKLVGDYDFAGQLQGKWVGV